MRNQMKRTPARAMRSLAALMMVLCLLVGMIPMAFAAESAGSKPADVAPSETKVYIRTNGAVKFFTGDLAGQGTVVTPAAGEVCQLVSDNWYTGSDGREYYGVYYLSNRYNVLKSDVASAVMSAEALETYITGTLWKQTVFETLRKSMGLVGDVRVHGVQLALQKLGYSVGTLDGSYGKQTHDAIAKFQRDQGLDADGSAGPLTQPVLYALASGETIEGGSTSGSTGSSSGSASAENTGTLRTIAPVNLRENASIKSPRLDEVPKNVNLSYTDTYSADGGVTWYQVRYAGQTGWVMGTYVAVTSNSSSSGTVTTPVATKGTLRTNVSVNLRKYGSKSSDRLDQVPSGVSLNYTDTYAGGGVIWYQVRYGGQTGWLMGTYITVTSTTSGSASGSTSGSTGTETSIGKVTITKTSTRVRTAPNGSKSGYVLSKGSVVDLLATPVNEAGYNWYKIRTASGLVGYVRGDCVSATIGSGSATVTSDKVFITLPQATLLFTEKTKPATGGETVPVGTVLMMYTPETYTEGGVEYCSLYYKNQKYNAVYAEVKNGIMSSTSVATYMENRLKSPLADALKREYDLIGNVEVYALQSALKRLGLYTGALDGSFGAGTQSAVRNFQRSAKITVDGSCGNETWTALKNAILNTGNTGDSDSSGSGSVGGGAGNTTTVQEFFAGATSVQKGTWDGDGVSLIPRGSYVSVLDVATQKVFDIYRWSGVYHADCVPATAADTKTMCDIVNFTYRDTRPSASHLANIIRYGKGEVDGPDHNYAWPDFGGHVHGHDIGAQWDRRAALVRVSGSSKIYAVSLYGFPHGFTGADSFAQAKFPDKTLFYERNNFYGMMCVHFIGSKTHGGNKVDDDHQEAIGVAYNWAKNNGYASICK